MLSSSANTILNFSGYFKRCDKKTIKICRTSEGLVTRGRRKDSGARKGDALFQVYLFSVKPCCCRVAPPRSLPTQSRHRQGRVGAVILGDLRRKEK